MGHRRFLRSTVGAIQLQPEGEAFFVVGQHPGASRTARRYTRPTLIFNLHDQFEGFGRRAGMAHCATPS